MPRKIRITEVGPRDGLQNEKEKLSLALRKSLIHRLAAAGVQKIEAGAFVSPKWVPQMANSAKLIQQLVKEEKQAPAGVQYAALVPNFRGMQDALHTGIKEVAVFGSCSESFSRKNINCSIDESFHKFSRVIDEAKKNRVKVRGYLSMAFGCPYEGAVPQAQVLRLVKRMLKLGVTEVSLGDTIGVATPRQVEEILKKIAKTQDLKKVGMHFHDTRGMALANIKTSLDMGVTSFDSSLGGLGGCPYAKGATGNVATEDVVYMLHGMGYKTGIDIAALIKTTHWMEKRLGRHLPARVSRAGLPK